MIEQIYQNHIDTIYKYFYYRTYDVPTSEDLTSQTFLIFVEKMKGHSVNKPEKFLYGVMRKVWLRHLQRKYEQAEQLGENMDDFQAHVLEEVTEEERLNDSQRVARYINLLPPSQQRVMSLRLVKQLSLSQICQVLGKDMNYVKTTQKRGIKKLKQLIEDTALNLQEEAG